jgi:hypothetical protein
MQIHRVKKNTTQYAKEPETVFAVPLYLNYIHVIFPLFMVPTTLGRS